MVIKRNAWISAAATIMPDVTIGENAVVAAGAGVTKDVMNVLDYGEEAVSMTFARSQPQGLARAGLQAQHS